VLACDRLEDRVAADHVVAPAQASVILANLTVRRSVAAALDIGTGPGVQAFLAARHARRVVATDVSPRALQFAAFNAALNGVRNVDFAEGSLLDPVRGSTFDLIVSNPPFVISPDRAFAFRDGGRRGDELCRELIQQVPDVLREGGYASVLVSWFHRRDEEWSRPVRAWIEGRGCDAWLVRFEVQDSLSHAAAWNRPPYLVAPQDYEGAIDRWLGYTRELGAELISSGAVILRRRTGANWVRADEVAADRIGAAGEQVARLFEIQDYLEARDEQTLLDERLRVADDARIDQVLKPGAQGLETESAAIRLTKGLGFRAQIDSASGRLLARLDGRRRLRQAITETAAELRTAGAAVDPSGLERAALPLVRRMLEAGFVERP